MSEISPRVRRNNLVTLVLLILFAIGLCAMVLISMRIHAQRQGMLNAPTPSSMLWHNRA